MRSSLWWARVGFQPVIWKRCDPIYVPGYYGSDLSAVPPTHLEVLSPLSVVPMSFVTVYCFRELKDTMALQMLLLPNGEIPSGR